MAHWLASRPLSYLTHQFSPSLQAGCPSTFKTKIAKQYQTDRWVPVWRNNRAGVSYGMPRLSQSHAPSTRLQAAVPFKCYSPAKRNPTWPSQSAHSSAAVTTEPINKPNRTAALRSVGTSYAPRWDMKPAHVRNPVPVPIPARPTPSSTVIYGRADPTGRDALARPAPRNSASADGRRENISRGRSAVG